MRIDQQYRADLQLYLQTRTLTSVYNVMRALQ